MKKLKTNWTKIFLVVFLLSTYSALTVNLGRDALFDWDEGIYAELGSELIESGSLLTNSWNYRGWFEKPPGISWLSATGQLLAGRSPYGARLLMPLVSTLTLLMMFLLGKKLKNDRVGMMSAGFLLGFNLFLARTRAVNTDMPLLLGIITTLYLVISDRKAWGVALAVAFSVWFKGLAGLLPLIISLPLLIGKGKKYLTSLTAWCIALIAPWHLYVLTKFGKDFLNPYFFEQVVSRVTTPIEFHLESRWFYLEYLYQNLGLGMVIVLALSLGYLGLLFLRSRKLETPHILVWWLAIPIIIFTLAKTRLFWYILPVYPALALLLSYYLDSFAKSKTARLVLTILAVGVLAQGLYSAYLSVEPSKLVATVPDRIQVASDLGKSGSDSLLVLVPPSERLAEAILPESQRISSSFRYGGMPSVVFYYQSPVIFFYNVDEFLESWNSKDEPVAMIAVEDDNLVSNSQAIVTTDSYLGIRKEMK